MKADSMTTDIKVLPAHQPARPADLLDLIQATVHNPDIKPETIREFLTIQREMEDRAAEKAFNSAFHAMQMELPAIVKDGKAEIRKEGKLLGSYDFSKYDSAMMVIKPIMRKHGFSESFLSEETPSGVLIKLTVQHSAGHSKQSTMRAPADKTGAKNDLQALGSSQKYCWRYLIFGFLAIICDDYKDKDGASEPEKTITEKEYSNLLDLIAGTETDQAKFTQWASKRFGITKLTEIPASKYTECVNALRAKQERR